MSRVLQYFKSYKKVFLFYFIGSFIYFSLAYLMQLNDVDGLAPLLQSVLYLLVVPGIVSWFLFSQYYVDFNESRLNKIPFLVTTIISVLLFAILFTQLYSLIIVINDGYFVTGYEIILFYCLALPFLFLSIIVRTMVEIDPISYGKTVVTLVVVGVIYFSILAVVTMIETHYRSSFLTLPVYSLLFIVIPFVVMIVMYKRVMIQKKEA